MSGFFNESYQGTPPWDIGRPQSEFVKLAREGEIRGRVLDVGCGTGENAIFFAGLGLEVWGIDSAPLAIEKARSKAAARRMKARFSVADALRLGKLSKKFDTVTDSGLFHVFSDPDRRLFSKSLGSALKKGGTYCMLCFSTAEPAGWGGPRRVSEEEIRATFEDGWKVNYVKKAKFESAFHLNGGQALLTSITLSR